MLQIPMPSGLNSLIRWLGWYFFQVNPNATQNKDAQTQALVAKQNQRFPDASTIFEIIAVFFVLATFAFTVVPDVNESHYLTKAKQFWNPNWCAGDLFLESSDAHYIFFLTFGWLTRIASLETAAWIGRIFCWFAFAWSWVFLNRSLSIRPWLSLITATLFMLLSNRFDMAGEWVVGGFEAKSVAYIFVVLAIAWMVNKKTAHALVALALAISFHAVIGIWAMSCFVVTLFSEAMLTRSVVHLNVEEYSRKQWNLAILFSAILMAAGCIPPLLANTNIDEISSNSANIIQVQQRLSHHLLFQSFPAFHVGRFAVLVAIWMVATRTTFISRQYQRLSWFCNFSLIISLCGIVLSGLAQQDNAIGEMANALLRFYWFRFSDFAIPLGIALYSARLLEVLYKSPLRIQRVSAVFSASLLMIASIASVLHDNRDTRAAADKAILPSYAEDFVRTEQTYQNWKKVCHWIKNNTRTDTTFLTPVRQQTFKWYAHRADFVCWKDMPQDAAGILKWRQRIDLQRRIEQIPGGALSLNDEWLDRLAGFGITHILMEQFREDELATSIPSRLSRIYPPNENSKSTYVVYKINGQK